MHLKDLAKEDKPFIDFGLEKLSNSEPEVVIVGKDEHNKPKLVFSGETGDSSYNLNEYIRKTIKRRGDLIFYVITKGEPLLIQKYIPLGYNKSDS